MKKLLILALGLLPMLPLLGQNRVVEVARISETFAPPTVTFRVYWNAAPDNDRHRDSVWVFVDYQTVDNNGPTGPWEPATLTPTSVSAPGTLSTVANGRGFYVKGTLTAGFSTTVTVALDGLTPPNTKFNWCAYATDYPPNATENNGYYDLNGTPPFEVNGTKLGEGVKTFNGGCITSLTDATGCPGILPAPPVVNTFAALPDSICPGGTATLTATATDAVAYSFDNDISWIAATASATTVVTPNQDTAYTVHVKNIAGCTATFAAAASVTLYSLPVPAFTNAPDSLCAGSTFTLIADGGASYCFSQTCDACIRNPYLTGNDSMGAANCSVVPLVCADYEASNSHTLTMPESGSVTVWVRAMSEHGCIDSTETVIVARPWATIRLLSDEATTQQTRGYNETIATVTYVIENASGATVTGLPEGVSSTYTNDTLTISGAPTEVGAYSYTVTSTGPCAEAFAEGTLTALPSVSMTTAADSITFTASVLGGYFTINWGDGSSESFTSLNTSSRIYPHKYTDGLPQHTITGTAASLTLLHCHEQQLSALDVRGATELISLRCYSNSLASLDVDKNTKLTDLHCASNSLIELDVCKNTALTNLYCSSNSLTTLDVSKNTKLTLLQCQSNLLEALNVSANTALTGLHCYNNQLTALDVSKNTALTGLYCYNNQLTALDVNLNTALKILYCSSNSLTALDVSKNMEITTLRCDNNLLTALDVSENKLLTLLMCQSNPLGTLDVSENTLLTYLDCAYNQLDTLDVSNNTALEYLYCHGNQLTTLSINAHTALRELRCYANPLTALDVSANTALRELRCYSNQLDTLDVSENTLLTYLDCGYNQLDTLDVSNNTALEYLYCHGNQLTTLSINAHTALRELRCYANQLTALNVSANTLLTNLQCYANQLTALNVSANTALTTLLVQSNQLSQAALEALFGTLHSNPGTKTISIGGNSGAGTCDRTIATNKGWTVN